MIAGRVRSVSAPIVIAASFVLIACSSQSASKSATDRVDELFAKWNRPDSPGCSVGISRSGTTVYERGYGIANLDLGVAITPATVFDAASVSKQFTAMSILLLAARGRLSLDANATSASIAIGLTNRSREYSSGTASSWRVKTRATAAVTS